jgi:iron-sulfur cluster assembly accessory protein
VIAAEERVTVVEVGIADFEQQIAELQAKLAEEATKLKESQAVLDAGGDPEYDLFFDERTIDGDAVVSFDGVEVVVDKKSAPYLNGASIDYEDTIQASGFQINNPNAESTCACGDSFN